jgi:hypothetical protein
MVVIMFGADIERDDWEKENLGRWIYIDVLCYLIMYDERSVVQWGSTFK